MRCTYCDEDASIQARYDATDGTCCYLYVCDEHTTPCSHPSDPHASWAAEGPILKIGDRVMGGAGDTFDVGTIHGLDGSMADVGWESGQRTPAHLEDLELYAPSFGPGGA